jgi:hypothetical protein
MFFVKCTGTKYVGVEKGRRWLGTCRAPVFMCMLIPYPGSRVVHELREALFEVRAPLDKGTSNRKVTVAVWY